MSAEIVKWQGRREHYSLEGFPKFGHVSCRHIRVGANAVQAASRINGIGFAEMPTRISSFVFLTQMAAAAAPNTTPSVLAHTSDIDVTHPSPKYCASSKEEALFQYGRPEIFNTDQGSQGGFKRSSQRGLCRLIGETGQAPLRASSNQASFGAAS